MNAASYEIKIGPQRLLFEPNLHLVPVPEPAFLSVHHLLVMRMCTRTRVLVSRSVVLKSILRKF